ncbi:MAG: hypothetical protein O7G88_19890, partial [bacterium]|nr:hypothetical protein [bacterium]
MDDREKQIPAPKSWMAFEDLCHRLFKAVWADPLTQKNGRSGQPQHGVDVFGSPAEGYAVFQGVQCKGKEGQYGSKPSLTEIEREIAKAEGFEPTLQHWIFATTAPVDATLQQNARQISAARAAEDRFTVSVLGWGEIESLLCEHKQVLSDIYPEYGFDFAKLLDSVQAMPHGSEVRELLDMVKRMGEPLRFTYGGTRAIWHPVVFGNGRDLGPALMGRSLGPEDAAACPMLPEADAAASELKRGYSVRIVGEPGTGKSVCAYQTALQFATAGWSIVRLNDPRAETVVLKAPGASTPTFFIIDDAHLMDLAVLRGAEDAAGPEQVLLSTHNAITHDASMRGAINIDAKRAVRTIASALRAAPEQTLEVVQRVDDQVGHLSHTVPLEARIAHAEESAQVPWQFCFILGGGWRRATGAADASRAVHADITLAGVAIRQLVSRDERPSLNEIYTLLEIAGITEGEVLAAVQWLVQNRLLNGSHDLRCPHQRFAAVVLGKILEGQDVDGRERVGRMLQHVVADAAYRIAGLRLLLHELHFSGDFRQWTFLIPGPVLAPLIERCWKASGPEEIAFASLLLSEIDAYVEGWPKAQMVGREQTVGRWISDPVEPSGSGIARLLHAVSNKDNAFAVTLVEASDPRAVAEAISAATPKTAYNLGELLSALHVRPDTEWGRIILENLDHSKLIGVAAEWPASEPASDFANFCKAVAYVDEAVALDMVECFTPIAQKLLSEDPISAFRDLDDIAWHVLRMLDFLGVYVGKLAPKPRHRALAAKMLETVTPSRLAEQLSASPLRRFQHITWLLAFMARATPPKFRATVSTMDWTRIAETIGHQWRNLPHDAEVLFGIAYGAKSCRETLKETIHANLPRIEAFPPRLVLLAPLAAYEHVEQGGLIRLAQHDHVDWRFGTGVIACFADDRPDLLEAVLKPSEVSTGRVLSSAHPSFYEDAANYARVIAQAAPESLQRILDAVDVTGAQNGWATALAH